MKRTLLGIFAVFALMLTVVAVSPPAGAQAEGDSDGDDTVFVDGSTPSDTPAEDQPSVDESTVVEAEGEVADGIDVAPLIEAADAARDADDQAAFDAAVSELATVDQAIADAQQHDWDEAHNASPPAAGAVNVQAVGILGDPLGCTFTTIQAAVNAASPGDSIIIEPDTYTENLNIDKRVNLLQSNTAATDCSFNLFSPIPDPANLVIQPTFPSDAVLELGNNGATDNQAVNVSYMTIQNAAGSEGNIFVTDGYQLNLTNVRVLNGINTSTEANVGGGGIRVNEGSTLTTNSIGVVGHQTLISGNRANNDGGGIHIINSTLELDNTVVSSNQADEPGATSASAFRSGGGIFINDTPATIIDSSVNFNNAEDLGGGIAKGGTGTLSIDGLTIINGNSSSEGVGGGIGITSSLLVVDGGARISNNTAVNGGGIFFGSGSDADLGDGTGEQVIVRDNEATTGNGGGINWSSFSALSTITGNADNILFEGNEAGGFGGGLYVSNERLNIFENGCLAGGVASLGIDQYCNEFLSNHAELGGGGIWVTNTGDLFVEQAHLFRNTINTGSGDVGTAIGADADGIVDVRTTLITGHSANNSSAVVDFDGASDGTLIAVTFADNGGEQAVDNDSSVTTTTSRILTETRFQGGSYSGFCNFVQTGENFSIPNATVGDIGFVSTDRSDFEPNSLSNAVDICTTDQGTALDIFDGGVEDGDDNGSVLWDAGAIEVRYPTLLCNGLSPTIIGTDAGEVINGTPGNDVILALGGDDTINGLGGNDTYCAGDGDDAIFDVLGGNDWAAGGAGEDTIVLGIGNDVAFGGSQDDTLNGGPGDDELNGGAGNDGVFGQGGDDVLTGGLGDDTVTGLDGDDTIEGNLGADVLNGGPDDDNVLGGPGDDFVFGLDGDDDLDGGAENDLVLGQEGNDIADGGTGDDQVLGNEDNDILSDPSGDNVLNGGPGDDEITGGTGDDNIFGDGDVTQAGDDTIDGGLGSDQLIGFAGNDEITANDGVADTVNGGPGVDVCLFDGGLDTVFGCP